MITASLVRVVTAGTVEDARLLRAVFLQVTTAAHTEVAKVHAATLERMIGRRERPGAPAAPCYLLVTEDLWQEVRGQLAQRGAAL